MMPSADMSSCWSKPLIAPAAVMTQYSSESAKPATKAAAQAPALPDCDAEEDGLEDMPLIMSVLSYISYTLLVIIGYFRELLVILRHDQSCQVQGVAEKNRQGYAPLFASFESFYTRNIFRRLKDIFSVPIGSVPGATVKVLKRNSNDNFWTLRLDRDDPGKECINLASYNYLGFAENDGPCTNAAIDSIDSYGLSNCSSRHELGTLAVNRELEQTVAQFLGVEDAVAFGMGFATNALNLPRLISKGCLVLSDEKNHASLILGLRLSGATVMVFKHNNMDNLERILRRSILNGHPRTRRPWRKILIVVEGVYSMEGTICKLPEIVALKKKYGAYLYLDEAHSVGAMGPRGRGVVDYYGLNPKDIDMLMGTFTKSFGSAGGYIAGTKALISHLRVNSQAFTYATSISPPVAQQIISSMRAIMGDDGKGGEGLHRVVTLAKNSRYFRQRLRRMGCIVYGHDDSPVVPMMIFLPAKVKAMANYLMDNGVAMVGVGFPATPMTEERARFCISAGHTKEQLDYALSVIEASAEQFKLKYSRRKRPSGSEVIY